MPLSPPVFSVLAACREVVLNVYAVFGFDAVAGEHPFDPFPPVFFLGFGSLWTSPGSAVEIAESWAKLLSCFFRAAGSVKV